MKEKVTPKVAEELVRVVIYSWRDASWREIQSDDWGFTLLHQPGIFYEGKLFWAGKLWERQGEFQRYNGALISFDLSTETFGCIDLPEELQGEFCSFGVVEGRITAVVCRAVVEVWQYTDNVFRNMGTVWTNRPDMHCLMQPMFGTGNAMVLVQNKQKITVCDSSNNSRLHALALDKWLHQGRFVREGPRMEAAPLAESLFSPIYVAPEDQKG
uniref:uncharacterized protein LOC105350607 n=1 Tax=Fragaria vesca subsp. vesca TaxID=101020 RepID=UPI0005C8355E|nr:PREDICTED: uncharacterized protein LOC105350607 [Fragaria vesca subsp. vesca]